MTTEATKQLKFQDDPEVLAFQFINEHETPNGGKIRFGGNAYLKEGLTWDEVFKGLQDQSIVHFINGKAQVWKKRRAATQTQMEGFQRF